MDVKEKDTIIKSFVIKKSTNEILEKIRKDVNSKVHVIVSRSQIIDMLIQDAERRDVSRLILTY